METTVVISLGFFFFFLIFDSRIPNFQMVALSEWPSAPS